jgi:glycosyltransferase involved in cell wall biosynthesis
LRDGHSIDAKMKASVAMATYNGAEFLSEQLESLAQQTRLPDELVVTDDGSSDATLDLLRDFAESAPFPVRLERNERNLGYAKNFEKAASFCSGDIVFFCDQDDVWLPQKIARMAAAFEGNPDLMVVMCDASLCDERMRRWGRTQLQNILASGVSAEGYITGCASAHRKTWFDAIMPPPPNRTHDSWINNSAHICGLSHTLPEPLIDYRRHETNASQSPLSNPGRVGAHSLIDRDFFASQREAWLKVASDCKLLLERLDAAPKFLTTDAVQVAHQRVENTILSFERRIDACSRGRLARIPSLVRMWLVGDYRHFLGFKSLAKDLIRP